jgi:hypothetical protein
MDLYIHSPIRLHGVVFNQLSTGTTLPFMLLYIFILHTFMLHFVQALPFLAVTGRWNERT